VTVEPSIDRAVYGSWNGDDVARRCADSSGDGPSSAAEAVGAHVVVEAVWRQLNKTFLLKTFQLNLIFVSKAGSVFTAFSFLRNLILI
jgi:hypothetical protein